MFNVYQSLAVRQLSLFFWIVLLVMNGCNASNRPDNAPSAAQVAEHTTANQQTAATATADNVLPTFTPVTLAAGETLQVVASTNLVADVVAHIGGDHIALHSLIGPGVDPHSYASTPQDLRRLANAQVVFINGLHLEAALNELLETRTVPVVSVNVGVATYEFAEEAAHEEGQAEEQHDEHHHTGVDPHTWQNVANVKVWVANIRSSLSQLDPANAAAYATAAEAYLTQLDALDAEIRAKVATIPAANRKLVTDHETFGYFANAYGFTVIGALIPSLSTAAEPSAQALAALQDQIAQAGVKAVFVGTTVNPRLAEQLAQDLGIQVVSLYSDSLSAPNGPAATYLDFMRYNVDAIVNALQ